MCQKEDKESCSINRRLAKLLCSARPSSARLCRSFVRDAVCLKSSLATQNSASPSQIPLPPLVFLFLSVATHSKQTDFQLSYRHHLFGARRLRTLERSESSGLSRLLPSSKNRQKQQQFQLLLSSPNPVSLAVTWAQPRLRLLLAFFCRFPHPNPKLAK